MLIVLEIVSCFEDGERNYEGKPSVAVDFGCDVFE